MKYVEMELSNGETINFGYEETPESESDFEDAGAPEVFEDLKRSIKDEAEKIGVMMHDLQAGMVDKLNKAAPGSLELDVELSYNQKLGFVVASNTAGVKITVKMKWENKNKQ